MSRLNFYPGSMPTRRRQLLRYVRWLGLGAVVICMALGAAYVIATLSTIDAQLDSAFMQGMKAGSQLCPSGA